MYSPGPHVTVIPLPRSRDSGEVRQEKLRLTEQPVTCNAEDMRSDHKCTRLHSTSAKAGINIADAVGF